jgi:succinyl-diaminopimelate desuccinylase
MDVVELASRLIKCPSITPHEAGCHLILEEVFEGWKCEYFDQEGVSNFVASIGTGFPTILFAGHCDVVPPGDRSKWMYNPFEPIQQGSMLYGRGSADMKGSLAAMALAMKSFVQEQAFEGRLIFLSTSDEEGLGVHGTPFAIEQLKAKGEKIDFAVVGEPTSEQLCGDTIKVGRRGSLNVTAIKKGVQGHVAYPHLAENPVHTMIPFLTEITSKDFDNGYESFSATSLQISNIQAGTGAGNVIPGEIRVDFNVRFNPCWTMDSLISELERIARLHDVELKFQQSAHPFLSRSENLISSVMKAIESETSIVPAMSTGGGTSDARVIAAAGIPVVEFGPLNKTIHQVNECISMDDLRMCLRIFRRILESLVP